MVELGSHAATERAAMVTLRLTVSRAQILSRQPHARICEGKSQMAELLDITPEVSRLAISTIDVEWPAMRSANQQCPARNSQTSGA